VDTGNAKRDEHLRGPDFFNAKEFPAISFKSTSLTATESDGADAGKAYTLAGDLTLMGVTKPITVQAVKLAEGKDPWGNFRIGFDTSFKIKRSDFGMTYGVDNGVVGDEVTIMLSFEGIKK